MNHTREPWYAIQNPIWGNADYRISNKEGDEWANFGQIAYASEFDAKRIVACVNACEDLTNKHLNDGVIYRLVALQGLVHTLSFGSDWNKGTHVTIVRDEIIKISNEIHKILVDGEDVW